MVNGDTIEKVDSMIYLGQLFTSDGRCIKEIIIRVQIARSTFTKMKTFFRGRDIKHQDKAEGGMVLCYLYTIVWSRDMSSNVWDYGSPPARSNFIRSQTLKPKFKINLSKA